ncbi:hypothetical protein [Rummeliibacillus suwonensis]|uniref:hypothetical protein n=1 Tax=Rummeliibacillus suwonensis TaxID=1306154 RepID=UPI001AAEBB56|nr:hypothetical protein [Rummeliibacillus suwonensis]MBO2536678.1 hypothetical protein [Rummeliibacillus suwonensis]
MKNKIAISAIRLLGAIGIVIILLSDELDNKVIFALLLTPFFFLGESWYKFLKNNP